MESMENGEGATLHCRWATPVLGSSPFCHPTLSPPGGLEMLFLGCLGFRDEGVSEGVTHSLAQLSKDGTLCKRSQKPVPSLPSCH